MMQAGGMYIDGGLVAEPGLETFAALNPATGRQIGSVVRGGSGEVDRAVRSARRTFESNAWRRMANAERGRMLARFAQLILQHEEELARLECADVGKPLQQARNDVRAAARYFEYYAGMADKVLGTTIPVRWGALDLTVREPYGVSAQIIPWNFPLGMAARGIAPALAAGNCVVAKPAEDASLSVLLLARIATEAGLPDGAFNVVTGFGVEAGAALVRHELVSHITFTGSVATGSAIMKMAADGVKPVSLELGGKSPSIVLADADLERAADFVVRSILVNAGQTCNSCPRLLVERSVHDDLLARIRARFDRVVLGDPLSDPDMGPVISARHRDKIESYMGIAASEGGTVSRHGQLSGDPAFGDGYFVRPAIISGVQQQHRVFQEEIFGPVLAVTPFSDIDEALALANATEFGLNAGVYTRDINKALLLAHRLEAGQVYINGFGTGGSAEVPFGGYKKSGIGREKGIEGFLHYTQVKSITAHFD